MQEELTVSYTSSMSSERKNAAPQIPGYRVNQLIGQGGMGAVYLGRRTCDSTPVAIKFAKVSETAGKHYLVRLRRELEISKTFAHPYVVKVLDGGFLDSGDVYIAMEYIEGKSLFEGVDDKMPVTKTERIFEHMAEALSYIHELKLVHRDIKPSNIVVESNGRTVLLDFGLVKSEDLTALTATGDLVGTFSYIAPELLRGKKATPAADVYSLGATIYWLLTQKHPFDNDALVLHCVNGELVVPVDLMKLRPNLPQHLARLVMDCLSVDPLKRPQNGSELLDRLKNKSRLKEEFEGGLREPHRRFTRSHFALLAVIILLLLSLRLYQSTPDSSAKKMALSRLEINTMRDELLNLSELSESDCETFGLMLRNSSLCALQVYPSDLAPAPLALAYLADHCEKSEDLSKTAHFYSTLYKRYGIKSTKGISPAIAGRLVAAALETGRGKDLLELIDDKETYEGPLADFTKAYFEYAKARSASIESHERTELLQSAAKKVRPLLWAKNTGIKDRETCFLLFDILGQIDTRETRNEVVKRAEEIRLGKNLLDTDKAHLLHMAAKKLGGYHDRDFTLDVAQRHQQEALRLFEEALSLAKKNAPTLTLNIKLDLIDHLGRMKEKARAAQLLKTIAPRALSRAKRCDYHVTCIRLALEELDFREAFRHLREAKLAAPDETRKKRIRELRTQIKSMRILSGMN